MHTMLQKTLRNVTEGGYDIHIAVEGSSLIYDPVFSELKTSPL